MKSPSAATLSDPTPVVVPEAAIEVLTRSFEVTPTTRLLVNVPRANIQLRPGRDRHIDIRMFVAGCDKDAAYAYVDDMSLRTRHADGVVRIKPDRMPQDDTEWWRRLRRRTGTLYVDLRLPRPCHADIQAAAGAVDAAGLEGKLAFEINAGALRAENLAGRFELFARSSHVDLRNLTGKSAALNVYTSPLHLDGLHAAKIDIEAAASPLVLRRLEGTVRVVAHGGSTQVRGVQGTLRASTFGGSLSATDIEADDAELTASGGDITIGVPSSRGADVSLRADTIHLDDALSFSGERDVDFVEGPLNGGGATLRARAHHGSIRCERA